MNAKMTLAIGIGDIRKENLDELMPELLSLEYNWSGIGETSWSRQNFKRDLAGKWELSTYAMCKKRIVGYAICSVAEDAAKLNKILVDKEFRGKGVASRLWREFLNRCRQRGLRKIEFKSYVENKEAVSFYRKKGSLFYGEELGEDNRMRHLNRYVFRTKQRVKHSKPTINPSDIDAVTKAMSKGDIATGNVVCEFVSEMCRYVGKEQGVATSSGSSALHLSLRALDIKSGDEVILPSYVCGSVLGAVEHSGATPIITDINEDDYNISFEDSERKITARTKAIIIPHMFGKPLRDMKAFLSLNIPLIEDCALSVGAEHKGRKAGSFGKLSVFSFYATKVLAAGFGGMALTDDEGIMERLSDLTKYDKRERWGENYNYRMSDLQAALGLNQLRKLDALVKRRKEIARRYNRLFKDAEIDFALPEDKEHIFFRYIVRHPERAPFMDNVRSRGVDVERPIHKPLHLYLSLADNQFPNTTRAYEEAVSIPLFPSLTDNEVEDIAGVLVNWKNEK